jgi:26S proteasome regulatory subunit N10
MKKNNVFIDFVLFGELEDDETQQKLQAFNDVVKVNDGCHMVVIPPSGRLLSDQLISTPIMLGETTATATNTTGLEAFDEFGFDPAVDPELALALRMSMEEEKSRQEKLAREKEESEKDKLEKIDEKEEEMPLLDISGSSKDADKGGDKPGDGDKMDTS